MKLKCYDFLYNLKLDIRQDVDLKLYTQPSFQNHFNLHCLQVLRNQQIHHKVYVSEQKDDLQTEK